VQKLRASQRFTFSRDIIGVSHRTDTVTKLTVVPAEFAANDALLSFVAVRADATFYASGSGVLIAPGIALTAKHVLKDYSNKLEDEASWRDGPISAFGIQAIQFRTDGPPVTWDVWSASFLEPLDIALVQLAPRTILASDFCHVTAKLEVCLPKVGHRVQAFGCPHASVTFDEHLGWRLDAQPQGAVGCITQVFADSRDSVSLPFPSFEMNTQVLGGMSGGPVFHENGRVCGILCSSFELLVDTVDVSYASLVQPALALRIRAAMDLGVWGGADSTLAQLGSTGDIDVQDASFA
jgi:hypothetical protein